MPQPLTSVNDFVVKFANVNGSGSASANALFAKSILRMGIPASSRNIFPSNIQGLPTWYEVRISEAGHLGARGGIDLNGLAIDEKLRAALLHGLQLVVPSFGATPESPVYGVVLQHVRHIPRINKRVIDADDFYPGIVQGGTKDQPPDPTKAIDSNLRHRTTLPVFLLPGCRDSPHRFTLTDGMRPEAKRCFILVGRQKTDTLCLMNRLTSFAICSHAAHGTIAGRTSVGGN